MSRFHFQFAVVAAALVMWSGCAKVEEATKAAAEKAKQAVASAASGAAEKKAPDTSRSVAPPSAPAAPATPSQPPVDEDRVLREISALRGVDMDDDRLKQLAALSSPRRESVTKLDLHGSSVSDEGIALLTALPNLAELNLEDTRVTPASLDHVKELKHLTSLNLKYCTWGAEESLQPLLQLSELRELLLRHTQIGDPALATLAQIKTLRVVDISDNHPVSVQGIAELTKLPVLEGLGLGSMNEMVFPEALTVIAKCKSLRDLDISANSITDEQLSVLKAFPALTSLNCHNNPITDQGMVFIKPLKGLIALDIRNTRLSDQGFSLLSLPRLQKLAITGISDQGMTLMKRFPDLRELNISETGVGDLGMAQLKGLKKLELLDISHTQVSDRGLAELVGLKNLKNLEVYKSGVTEAGVEGITKAISGLSVSGLAQ